MASKQVTEFGLALSQARNTRAAMDRLFDEVVRLALPVLDDQDVQVLTADPHSFSFRLAGDRSMWGLVLVLMPVGGRELAKQAGAIKLEFIGRDCVPVASFELETPEALALKLRGVGLQLAMYEDRQGLPE